MRKGYRVRIFSDLHLHPFSYGARITSAGHNSRLLDAAAVLTQILTAAPKPDLILFGGDLFHSRGRLPTTAINQTVRVFSCFRETHPETPILCVPGNHDLVGAAGGESALRLLPAINPRVCLAERTRWYQFSDDGPCILAIPYQTEIDTGKLQEQISLQLGVLEKRKNTAVIVLAHNGFVPARGSSPFPGEPTYCETDFAALWPHHLFAVFGHWHSSRAWFTLDSKMQQVDFAADYTGFVLGPTFLQIGAPMQHNWGDAEEVRGWYDIEWNNGWQVHRFESRAPKFVEIGPSATTQAGKLDFVRIIGTPTIEVSEDSIVERLPAPEDTEDATKGRADLTLGDSSEQTLQRYVEHTTEDTDRAARLLAIGREALEKVTA